MARHEPSGPVTHSLVWGLAAAGPFAFAPPAASPGELSLLTEAREDYGPLPLTLQADPVRRLENLAGFPIAVMTAESSLFTMFHRHLVAFLEQAGCDVELVRFADRGVHGNGHGMMLESNNEAALAVIEEWVDSRLGR